MSNNEDMMKKERRLMLIGRSEAGKTTLSQALSGKEIGYEKTQAISMNSKLIDTPGEYIQTKNMGTALAIYSYEADVIGLLLSATEPFSLFSPNITCMTTKEVIGIITKTDHKNANVDNAEKWLRLAGCKKIFKVNSLLNEGIDELKDYLGWKRNTKKHR